MKKLLGFLGLLVFTLMLAGCGNSDTPSDEEVTDNVAVEADATETADTETEDIEVKKLSDIQDYQLRFVMKMADVKEGNMSMDVNIYKKGSNIAYVFNSMDMGEEAAAMMPFVPKKVLVLGEKAYTQFDQGGTLMWLEVPAEDEDFASSMFDFEEMEEIIEAESDSKKVETIKGEKVTCYYKKEATEESKVCLKDGIMYYVESTDPANGGKVTMDVSEYSTKVDDDVFVAPEETISMEDLMAEMMKSMGGLEGMDLEGLDMGELPQ